MFPKIKGHVLFSVTTLMDEVSHTFSISQCESVTKKDVSLLGIKHKRVSDLKDLFDSFQNLIHC